jgi:hypothetical protein
VAPHRGFWIRLPCFHVCQPGLLRPADRLVRSATIYDRRIETSRTRDRERPRVRCRQSPASGTPGSEAFESGSSPVSSRYARGICLRRATPSFCLRTSQCAFAVRGEMPRPLPNLFVGATVRDQLDDLLLSRSQNGRARLEHRRHGIDGNNEVLVWLLTDRRISRLTPPAVRAPSARTRPRAPARSRSATARARARRFAPAARTRRAGVSASSRGRPSRS